MNLFKKYVWERRRAVCAYIGIPIIFAMVLFLYDIHSDAIGYACLLSVVWIVAFAVMDFAKYAKKYRELVNNEKRVITDDAGMSEPMSLIEEEYQKIIHRLYEEKMELESNGRISRQEMMDYYGMWVHQIKNPIAALNVLIQTCETQTDEESMMLLRSMKMELFRIEQYVEMALMYLRLEEMSSDLSFARYSLDDIIRQAVRKCSQLFILKKISLKYEPIEEEVLTDEKWMVFVLEQILSNALKYTKTGSISIYKDGKNLVIEDTGIGIQAEDLPRVFEKGFTGYNGRADKKSTGIGLYLSKSIMDKLSHRIWIESEVGKGTRVYLYLEREELKTE